VANCFFSISGCELDEGGLCGAIVVEIRRDVKFEGLKKKEEEEGKLLDFQFAKEDNELKVEKRNERVIDGFEKVEMSFFILLSRKKGKGEGKRKEKKKGKGRDEFFPLTGKFERENEFRNEIIKGSKNNEGRRVRVCVRMKLTG
jgi:hypothetical protein